MTRNIPAILLASTSSSRNNMMKDAGILFEAFAPMIDEDMIKQALIAECVRPRQIADTLAEAKSVKISRKFPAAFVIGSDQILVGPDGQIFDKPENKADAIVHITALAGKTHQLICAVVVSQAGKPVWRHLDTAYLTMRPLTSEYILSYVEKYWDTIQHCVGCYRIEAEGAELFECVNGDRHIIMGMPLTALLDYLSIRGLTAS